VLRNVRVRYRVGPKKIAVLLLEENRLFETTTYLLRLMMEAWTAQGHAVEVVRGVDRFVHADLMIPHLDLTVTPDPYRDFINRYPIAVNGRVVDVSKSKISLNIVQKSDPYDGPVIVKTDRNYGGLPESRLTMKARPAPSILRRIVGEVVSKLGLRHTGPTPWKSVESMDSGSYPVFSSLEEVPNEVFENKNIVVEKFFPEVKGADYCLRYYYFFGDKEMNILLKSREKVVKGSNAFQCDEVPVPPELRAIRRRMGFDYRKFDYVLRDGKVVIFDVNRTPSYSTLETKQISRKAAGHLAEGIVSLLEPSPASGN
jgi:hypothetical protein